MYNQWKWTMNSTIKYVVALLALGMMFLLTSCKPKTETLPQMKALVEQHWEKHMEYPNRVCWTFVPCDGAFQLLSNEDAAIELNLAFYDDTPDDTRHHRKFRNCSVFSSFDEYDEGCYSVDFDSLSDDVARIASAILIEVFGCNKSTDLNAPTEVGDRFR